MRGRSSEREGTSEADRPAFGRIDPFCWLAVVPALLLAVWLTVGGAPEFGIPLACTAIGLLFFDAWVNRPQPSRRHPRLPAGTHPPRPRRRPPIDEALTEPGARRQNQHHGPGRGTYRQRAMPQPRRFPADSQRGDG